MVFSFLNSLSSGCGKLGIERFSPKVCIAGHSYVNTKWQTLKKGFLLDAQSVKITFIRVLGLVFLLNGKKS